MKNIMCILFSIFSYLIGGIDHMLISLLIMITIDYITGVLKGIYECKLSSRISIKGIIKKIGYLLVVIVATIFDRILYDDTFAIRTLVIYFFLANESISILENWSSIGLPLPKKLKEITKKLKNDENI